MFKLLPDSDSGESSSEQKEWYPAKEIAPTQDLLSAASSVLNVSKISFGDVSLLCLHRNCVLDSIEEDPQCDISIHEAEKNHSDLIPAKYEGGLKIWECSGDLAEWIQGQEKILSGATVLDLGCGSGLLGILAQTLSAPIVHYQDYNSGVIKHWTIPNVALNLGNADGARFWCGDWGDFANQDEDKTQYDVILSSETLYNPECYQKLYNLLQKKLKPTGVVYFAAKAYYFGVGGSTKSFSALITGEKKFTCETVWKSQEGVQREILEVKWANS